MTRAELDMLRAQLVIVNQASMAALQLLAKDDPEVVSSGDSGMPPLLGKQRPAEGPGKE